VNLRHLIAAAIILFIHGNALAAAKTIHFGTEAAYPPFEYVDSAGSITGFDIAIASAACNEMHAQCTFSNQPFNSLLPSLTLGKFDALIAAMGVTAERQQQVLFTNAYYEPSASFIAPIAAHMTLADVKGKQIGVQTGSVFEKFLQDKYGNHSSAKPYVNTQEALLDLNSGRIDVVLIDTPIAKAWLQKDNHQQLYQIVAKPLVNHDYFGAGYGIALRKNDTALAAEFNRALAAIKKNGVYDKIKKQYGL